jgi:Ser/Thr protein kinase RdoA (MazF antagonist)
MKPMVTTETAINLAKTLFGFSEIHKIKELISFCDRNFYIKGLGVGGHHHQANEFVLKLLNSVDSQNSDQIDAELKALEFLRKKGFPCPEIFNIKGTSEKMAVVRLPVSDSGALVNENSERESCVVRLIAFLPGDMVCSLDRNPDLMFAVGKFAGAFSLEMKVSLVVSLNKLI